MAKQVKVTSIIRKLYVEDNGSLVEVKQIDNAADYGKDVKVYTKEAAKGTAKGTTLYAVGVADFVPKKRASSKEATANLVQSLKAEGLTADEILARLTA